MPAVCSFDAFEIYFHWGIDEHPPPHFHVYRSGDRVATIYLDTDQEVSYIRNSDDNELNRSELNRVCDWADEHYAELMTNWRLVQPSDDGMQHPRPIDPPESG